MMRPWSTTNAGRQCIWMSGDATSLLERFTSVEEIANMVIYVASKQASATNGAALRAEGGTINSIG